MEVAIPAVAALPARADPAPAQRAAVATAQAASADSNETIGESATNCVA